MITEEEQYHDIISHRYTIYKRESRMTDCMILKALLRIRSKSLIRQDRTIKKSYTSSMMMDREPDFQLGMMNLKLQRRLLRWQVKKDISKI